MKKATFILAALLIVFSANQASAQLGFQLGIKGGPNFNSIKTEVSTEGQTGFHAGAYVMLKFTKIAIQPEILFSTQNTELDVRSVPSEISNSYINIPVIVKLYLIGGLNLQVGPQFGFTTLSELTDIAGGTTTDIAEDLKSSDVSLVFGLGIDLPFRLNASARYNLGISNINDTLDLGLGTAADSDLRNQVFQVSVGYAFIKK